MLVDLEESDTKSVSLNQDCGIKMLDSKKIVYSDFFFNFIHQNKPCIIKNVTSDWECQRLWVLNGLPNLDYLDSHYGNANVPVANCNEKYYNSQMKTTMLFKDFTNYWRNCSKISQNDKCLYLKDWHFLKTFHNHRIYQTPKIFASDWLNEYLLSSSDFDDYRFVYMGPKGSWTPLHADVFSSFSWSVNICGKKKWAFFPPGQECNLKDKFGKLAYSIESEDLKNLSLYPNYKNLIEPCILIQEVGDAVFVPSEWHHQVWNLEDTISINHNWVNACNIRIMWKDLLHNLNQVEKELSDCQDMENWDEQCQLVLKSVYGMDFTGFFNFIFYLADVRLDCLNNDTFLKSNHSGYRFGKNHILYDLISIFDVLKEIKEKRLTCVTNHMEQILDMIERIKERK